MKEDLKGKRIRLIHMEDAHGLPAGSTGEILYEDDMGQIHVRWDSGSSLAVIPGVDLFEISEEG